MVVKNTLTSNITDFLRQKALDNYRHDCIVGFADVSHIVDASDGFLPYSRAISFGLALDPNVVSHMSSGSKQEYIDEFSRVDMSLQSLSEDLKFYLESLGYRAITFKDALVVLDEADMSQSDLPMLRHGVIAANAGLGWIGKSSFVVTKLYGGAIRLSTVFTDAPIECCTQSFLSRCGRCVECIDVHSDDSDFDFIDTGSTSPEFDFPESTPLASRPFESTADGKSAMVFNWDDLENIKANAESCGMRIHSCPYTKAYLERKGFV